MKKKILLKQKLIIGSIVLFMILICVPVVMVGAIAFIFAFLTPIAFLILYPILGALGLNFYAAYRFIEFTYKNKINPKTIDFVGLFLGIPVWVFIQMVFCKDKPMQIFWPLFFYYYIYLICWLDILMSVSILFVYRKSLIKIFRKK
jgi:hypothetical protein